MPLPRFFTASKELARGNVSLWQKFPRIKSVPTIKDSWRLLYTLTKDPLVKVQWDHPLPMGVIHKNLMTAYVGTKGYGVPMDWFDWCYNTGITIDVYEKILLRWGKSLSYTLPKIQLDPYPYKEIYWAKSQNPTHVGFDYYSGLITLYDAQRVALDQRLGYSAYESVHYNMLLFYGHDDLYKHKTLITSAWGKYAEPLAQELQETLNKAKVETNKRRRSNRKLREEENPGDYISWILKPEEVKIHYQGVIKDENKMFESLIQGMTISGQPTDSKSEEDSDEDEKSGINVEHEDPVEALRRQYLEEFNNPFDENDQEDNNEDPEPQDSDFLDNG
jgi:hypothetical protein